jgi:photosystem II stability/assembly factor-like uncharacterized protein
MHTLPVGLAALPAPGNLVSPAPTPPRIDPVSRLIPRILLLGAGSDGAYSSLDDGQTWAPANNGLFGGVWQILADPMRPGAAYATTGDLYHTVDGGRHWKKVAVDGPAVADPGFTALAVLGNQVLVAGPSGIVSGGVTTTWAGGHDRGWIGAPRQLLALSADGSSSSANNDVRYVVTAAGKLLRQQGNGPWQPWGAGGAGRAIEHRRRGWMKQRSYAV